MDTSAPRLDCTGATPPIGYHHFHPDVSINFQCNRWVQWIGPSAIDELTEMASHADTYPEVIDGFLGLAERARAADRVVAGAVLRPGGRVLHDGGRPAPPGRARPVLGGDANRLRRDTRSHPVRLWLHARL